MKSPVLNFSFSALDGTHDCRVELGWFGTERYYVDNNLVLRQWSLLGKTAKFESHGTEILIRSHIVRREATMEASVNGNVIIENLLDSYNRDLVAKLNAFRAKTRPTLGQWLAKVVVWAVFSLFVFSLLKWLARSAA